MATTTKPATKLAKDGTRRGGARPNSGRKPAARAELMKKGKETANRILEQGSLVGDWPPKDGVMPTLPDAATPLDVMIEAMRRAYSLGGPIAAFPYAEKAAPYLHARISSIELKQPPPPGTAQPGSRFVVEFVRPKPIDLDGDTKDDDL